MFGGTGGYFRLDSWILANIIQLGTQRFCRLFLHRTNDPCGRQYDQMTQAARSGCANNAEGSAPDCPECGKPMTRRKARSGKNAGHDFWGCTGYPECRGLREIHDNESSKKSP